MKEVINNIYNDTKDNYFKILDDDLKKKRKKFIITVNPETLMLSEKDLELKEILNNKDYSKTADGIAIVKAARKLNIPIKERITGIDIATYLLDLANDKKYTMYLFGAKKEVIQKLKAKIEEEYPNINLVGYSDGYVSDYDKVMEDILKKKPDIVMLALGIPKQEKLINRYYDKFKKGILIGVGGSFDVLSGSKKRAPEVMIKLNLEWLYRIVKEPKRLKRFYDNNIKFMVTIRKKQ